jgi:hypothetical protein
METARRSKSLCAIAIRYFTLMISRVTLIKSKMHYLNDNTIQADNRMRLYMKSEVKYMLLIMIIQLL